MSEATVIESLGPNRDEIRKKLIESLALLVYLSRHRTGTSNPQLDVVHTTSTSENYPPASDA